MKKLAKAGVIPKKLEKVNPRPVCVACFNGKQHRTPWKGRGKNALSIRNDRQLARCSDLNELEMISQYGGMVPQMKGRLTKAKYYGATIFVDHHTNYTHVRFMRDSTAESTMEAKNAYEELMQVHGHRILAYSADNGRYAEKASFMAASDHQVSLAVCHQSSMQNSKQVQYG